MPFDDAKAAKGVVVAYPSGCDYYIVETNRGYALLEWYGGNGEYSESKPTPWLGQKAARHGMGCNGLLEVCSVRKIEVIG